MRTLARVAPLFVLALGVPTWLAVSACQAPTTTVQTESLGSFRIDGVLTDNACAPGIDPVNPLAFQVELRDRLGSPYWQLDRQPMVPGTLLNGVYRFSTRTPITAWDPNPAQGIVGCTLRQTESIEFRADRTPIDGGVADGSLAQDASVLDAGLADGATREGGTVGPPITSLGGTNIIEVVPEAGSDCRALLLSQGGSFPTFPCRMSYELVGVRVGQ